MVAPYEPLEILTALERHRVAYVVIGKLAGIIHGTGGTTDGVDVCPQLTVKNLERLQAALEALGGRGPRNAHLALDEAKLAEQPVYRVRTPIGEIGIVASPAGTRGGFDDLRRRASREPLGGGVRAPIAGVGDLVRIAATIDTPAQRQALAALRRAAEHEQARSSIRR